MSQQDLEYIIAFLRDELDEVQRQDFLTRLDSEANFKALFDLEKQQFDALGDASWPLADSKDETLKMYEQAANSDTIKALNDKLNSRKGRQKKSVPVYKLPLVRWAAAVVLIALVLASLLLGGKQTPQELYAQYLNLDDIPSLTVRSDQDSTLVAMEGMFRSGYYGSFINLAREHAELVENNSSLLLYQGLSYLEQQKLDEAISVFDKLIASDLIDAPRGHWFKALAYLKRNQPEKAKEILEYIINNKLFNTSEAEALLKQL